MEEGAFSGRRYRYVRGVVHIIPSRPSLVFPILIRLLLKKGFARTFFPHHLDLKVPTVTKESVIGCYSFPSIFETFFFLQPYLLSSLSALKREGIHVQRVEKGRVINASMLCGFDPPSILETSRSFSYSSSSFLLFFELVVNLFPFITSLFAATLYY